MPDQTLDYAAIQRSVERRLQAKKRYYRTIFFRVHLLLYLATMLIIWGIVIANSRLTSTLLYGEPAATLTVVLPTVIWGIVILCHIAAQYFDSEAGERALRDRLMGQEIGDEIFQMGRMDKHTAEKPKRSTTSANTERITLSDDGELILLDDDEQLLGEASPAHVKASR